jgi:hypothetical protein
MTARIYPFSQPTTARDWRAELVAADVAFVRHMRRVALAAIALLLAGAGAILLALIGG